MGKLAEIIFIVHRSSQQKQLKEFTHYFNQTSDNHTGQTKGIF